MKLNDYKRVMGRLTVSDELAERLKGGEAAPHAAKANASRRPRLMKVLSVAAIVATLALVITAFVLIVRFVGPETEPPINATEPFEAKGFKLISVSTGCDEAVAEVIGYDPEKKKINVKWSFEDGFEGWLIGHEPEILSKKQDDRWIIISQQTTGTIITPSIAEYRRIDETMSFGIAGFELSPGHFLYEKSFVLSRSSEGPYEIGEPVGEYMLKIEFELTDGDDDGSASGFEFISSVSDPEHVSVDVVGYDAVNQYLTLNWSTVETQALYLKANNYSMYSMRDGEWKLIEGSFTPSTTTADSPFDTSIPSYEWCRAEGDNTFYLAKFFYENDVVGHYKLVVPFAVQDVSLSSLPQGSNGSLTLEFKLNSKAVISMPEDIPEQRLNDGPGDYRADLLGGIVCDPTGLPYIQIEIQSYNIFTNTVEVRWDNNTGNEITLSGNYVIKKLVNGVWTDDWTVDGRAELRGADVKIPVKSNVYWELYELPASADGNPQGRYRIERTVIDGDVYRVATISFELTGEHSGLSLENIKSGIPGVSFVVGSYGEEYPKELQLYIYNGSESTVQIFGDHSVMGFYNGEWIKSSSSSGDYQALKSGEYSIAKRISLSGGVNVAGANVSPVAYKVEFTARSNYGETQKLSLEIWTSDTSEKYSDEVSFIGFESTEPIDSNGQYIAGIELEYIGFEHRKDLLSRSFVKYRLTNNSAYPLYYSKENGISVLRNDYWTQLEESPISNLNAKYTELAPGSSVELSMYCNDYLLSQLPVGVYELGTCYYISDPQTSNPIYAFVTCRYAVGEGVGMAGDGVCVVADVSGNNGNMSTDGRLTRVVGASYDKNGSRLTFRALNTALSFQITDAAVAVYEGAGFGDEIKPEDIVGKKYQPGVEHEFSFGAAPGTTVRLRWVISAVGSDGAGYTEERIVIFKID